MNNKKLAVNSLLYSIGTMLPQLAAFFLLPIYLNFLSPSEYGILNSVQVITSVLTIIYTLAIDKAIFRLYFDFKEEKSKKDFLGTVFIAISFFVILITSILFVFPEILESIYKNITFYPYISLSVIASALATFTIVPRSVYFVQEKAKSYILMTLSEFFLRNLFIYLFVVYFLKGLEGYLYGQIIGSAILAPIFLYITSKQINFKFIKHYLISALKYSIPMLPTFISVWIITAIDRVFIERYFDAAEVGIYSLGYKIAMLVTVITGSFYKAYNPFYFKLATTEIKEKALTRLKKTNTVYILLVIASTSLISLFSKEILYIFFSPEYLESYKIVSVVSLAFGISAFLGIFNLAIYQEKKTLYLMYINIIAAFVNVALNFIFVSNYGVMGAAWASVFTYCIVAILSYYYAKKSFYASFNSKTVIWVFLTLFSSNIFYYYFEFNFWTGIISKFFFVTIVFTFIWFSIKNSFFTIIKNIK